jgi:C-terminal processing protease CtpA/Prc
LVSINGVSVEKIYQRALEYACIEGQATQARDAVATAILPVVAGLMKPYGAKNIIDIIPLNSVKPVSMSLKGYRSKEYQKKLYQRHLEGKDTEVKFEMDEETNLAILKIGTFAPSSGRKYRKQIAEAMKRVIESDAQDLVLDIRGNGGGSSAWVEYVYSYIDPAGYNTPSNVIGRNSEIAMDRSRFFHTALGKIFTFLFFRNNEDVQSFRKIAALEYGEMDTLYFHVPAKQEQSQVFSGNCYLLINGLTASAGVDFTNAFKSRKRGPVIGEQCLGPQSGTWGNPAWFTLPNTGLRVSISTIRYNYDNTFEYQMSAIEPDFFVDCVPEDIRQEVDTQIEFVKKMIADKR